MEKKYRPGYKALLTSLTIATVLTNGGINEVSAAEEMLSNEDAIEQQLIGLVEQNVGEIQSQEAKDTASDDLFLTLETYSLANDEIYDNETLQPYRSITILHNGFLQYLDFYKGEETIDESIIKALNALEEELPNIYAFESVEVTYVENIADLSAPYYGPGYDITITVSALYDKKEWIQEVIELPFEIIYIDDPTGVEGDERIIQEGISGLKQVNYDVYYIDGIEIFREPIEFFD